MASRVDRKGADEYRRLVDALADAEPGCRDDWRFLLEAHEVDANDVTEMKSVCRGCPLADLCARYATAARPPAGMWAGRHYPPSQRRTRKETTA